jgi:tRNA(fMet)-specific endonuclease VapC
MARRAGRPAGPRGGAATLSRLLLDTSVLVDAERAGDLGPLLGDDDDVAMAALTLAELRVGALLGRGRRAGARNDFVDALAVTIPIVEYDTRVAEVHARLLVAVRRQGRPRGAHDLVIAATAAATDRVVVTGDPSGFAELPGVDVLAVG